jgi:diguanylate cyclase (GGDEF)-like protein
MKWSPSTITDRLQQISRPRLALELTGLLLMIWLVDYGIRWDLGLSIFYVLPIAGFTWYLHNKLGYVASFLSAALWFLAEKERYTLPENIFFLVWNTGIRLAFFLLIVQLLVELKTAFQRETALATTDGLTQLLNRRAFLEILEGEIQRSLRHQFTFTLVYLDVDNFKDINDALGHAAGDRYLQEIAQVFNNNLRSGDYRTRLGGDEFAVLMPQTDQEQATPVLQRLFEQLSNIEIEVTTVGVSMGAVTFQIFPESAEQALTIADQLMYEVKTSGKHQFVQQEY